MGAEGAVYVQAEQGGRGSWASAPRSKRGARGHPRTQPACMCVTHLRMVPHPAWPRRFLSQASGTSSTSTRRKPVNYHQQFAAMHAEEAAVRTRMLKVRPALHLHPLDPL